MNSKNRLTPEPSTYLNAMTAYGTFMVAWAVFEGVIQAAIGKELGIGALKTVIITGKLQFNPRAQLLISLLKLHGERHKEAISLLNKAEAYAKRNSIVHGLVGTNAGGKISFIKYDGGASAIHTFTADELLTHTSSVNERTILLQKLLNITNEDGQEITNATVQFAKQS